MKIDEGPEKENTIKVRKIAKMMKKKNKKQNKLTSKGREMMQNVIPDL